MWFPLKDTQFWSLLQNFERFFATRHNTTQWSLTPGSNQRSDCTSHWWIQWCAMDTQPPPPPHPVQLRLISYSFRQNIVKTRMHSRMCTVCSSGHLSCHAHTSCHACASAMHPLPHMPPVTHAPQPCTSLATHIPCHAGPPYHAGSPCHACPLPCMPTPVDRRDDTRLWKHYLSTTAVADCKYLTSNQFLVWEILYPPLQASLSQEKTLE